MILTLFLLALMLACMHKVRNAQSEAAWRIWALLVIVGGMLTIVTIPGCVTVQKVQVGPEKWPCFLDALESTRQPTSKPFDYNTLPDQLLTPASRPGDKQTPQEILDDSIEVFLERYQ